MTPEEFAKARQRKIDEALGEDAEGAAAEEAPEGGAEGSVGQSADAGQDDGAIGDSGQEVGLAAEAEDAAAPSTDERDEQGRTASEAAEEAVAALPEDATEEEREAAREDAKEEFYAWRYKTREETERGIAEANKTLQRQFQENAELRRELEAAYEIASAEQPQQLDRRQWEQWAEEEVENGGGQQAALLALQEGGWPGYEIFMRAWLSSEEPRQRAEAVLFSNAMAVEIGTARAEASFAPERERVRQITGQDESAEAQRMVAARRPDLPEYEDAMVAIVDELDPQTREYLQWQATQGVEGKARTIDYLYLEAKSRTSPRRAEAQRIADERASASGASAKTRATVASAGAAPPRTSTLTPTEERVLDLKNARRKAWGLPLLEE